MALLQATLITAIATAVLALFAMVTGFFAVLAFGKQSAEVAAIEQQAKDQQNLIRQQGELLQIQSGQLELQRQHFELQVEELKASIVERQQKAIEEWVRKQQWPH